MQKVRLFNQSVYMGFTIVVMGIMLGVASYLKHELASNILPICVILFIGGAWAARGVYKYVMSKVDITYQVMKKNFNQTWSEKILDNAIAGYYATEHEVEDGDYSPSYFIEPELNGYSGKSFATEAKIMLEEPEKEVWLN